MLNDADIVNMSLGIDVGGGISELCKDPTPTVAVTIIADEVVDAGVLFVKSAGNRGSVPPIDYTITSPGCGYNVFTIGNLNDMDTPGSSTTWQVHGTSSRGPSSQVGVFTDERIKPEVVAPGSSIFSHNNAGSFSILSEFDGTLITGTSFAPPHVTGLASLIKQANPTFTPIEMKSAIIAGADWANPLVKDTIINPATPFTAVTYESLTGIGKTNFDAWGLGLINATKSIDLVRNGNVILDKMLGIGPANKLTYTFTVTSNEVNQEQRIILTWLSHGFSVPLTNPVNPQQLSNLTLSLQDPSALIIADSTSKVQNNEFVIFTPTVQGVYTIEVSAEFIDVLVGTPLGSQEFALASTVRLNEANQPPIAVNDDACTQTGQLVTIFATEGSMGMGVDTDGDGDTLSIYSVDDREAPDGIVTFTSSSPSGGLIQFRPDGGFNGDNVIRYTVSDGNGGFDIGRVDVTVQSEPCTNLAPTANSQFIEIPEAASSTSTTITLSASDPDGNTLSFEIITLPVNGNVDPIVDIPNLSPTLAEVTYFPNFGYLGSDFF